MNKKLIVNLVLIISIFGLLYYFQGCSTDDALISPEDELFANGSLTPTSRTQVQGNMFVTDQNGNPIQGLDASNIVARLRWNAKDNAALDSVEGTVTITQSTTQEIAAALTMDYSSSMYQQQIQCMEDGVTAYINSMGATDMGEIIKFSDNADVIQAFTDNKTLLLNAVNATYPGAGGLTALYQSIYQGLIDANGVSSQYLRTVVAFTDGGENNSTVTRSTMIDQALNTGMPVFTVTLTDAPTSFAALDMKNIADTTGGFPFVVDPNNCGTLSTIYQQINNQLNSAYSITIDWPDTNPPLPPALTDVTAVVYVNYEGLTAMFSRTYQIP